VIDGNNRLPPPHDWHTAGRDGACDRGHAPGTCPARHWPGLPYDVAPGRAVNARYASLAPAPAAMAPKVHAAPAAARPLAVPAELTLSPAPPGKPPRRRR
jgi:hypothetical protein